MRDHPSVSDPLSISLLTVLVVLNFLDARLTSMVLREYGPTGELNPLMGVIISCCGFDALTAVKMLASLFLGIAIIYLSPSNRWSRGSLATASLIYLSVVLLQVKMLLG